MSLTQPFNILPRTVKDGLWIESLDISSKDKALSLSIKGAACLVDEGRESAAVKDFLAGLKDSRDGLIGLNNLEIVSLRGNARAARKITVFEISGS